MESERKTRLDSAGGSFNFSSASQHSIESHKDLQNGFKFNLLSAKFASEKAHKRALKKCNHN